MKAVFIHDHPFLTDGNNYYSDKLPYSTWLRYLQFFNKLEVFSRVVASVDGEGLPLSSGNNVTFTAAPNISQVSSFGRTRMFQRARLKKIISSCDAVIARLPSEYGLMGIQLARELGKSVVVEVVGCPWDALWNYGGVKSKLYAPILTYRVKKAVKYSDFVIYVSQTFLQSRYPASKSSYITAISNVEIPHLSTRILNRRLERIARFDCNFVIFGLIGSLKSRYKGVHVAIEALSILVRTVPNARLRILGGGDPDPYLKLMKKFGLSQEHVSFDGLLPTGDPVFNWLDDIDIYLQPSFQEGVPRSLIEAMSRGCPALASTAGGIPELLNGEATFSPGDVQKMFLLMRKSLENRDWLAQQAARNFNVAESYNKSILDARRIKFFNTFASTIKSG